MTRLQVELDDFVDAARLLHGEVAEPVGFAVGALARVLSGCGQMAGDDDGGRQWAAAYDQAAATLLSATSRYASGAFATAGMFARSAINYANADTAATCSAHPDQEPVAARLPPTTDVTPHVDPPSAAGSAGTTGTSDQPWGWSLITHLICAVWPNGDQGRLRRAAEAFRTCATTIDHAAEQPTRASILFARDRLLEVDDIIVVCRGITDRGRALADAHRALARSCDELADHLDHCHSDIEAELRQLVVETGTLQIAGGILAAVTFGIAEIPTQITQTALVTKVAAKVGELIDHFLTAARAAHALIPAITERVQTMLHALDTLANARVVMAAASRVDRLGRYSATVRGAGASAEIRSAARLQAEANNLRRGSRGREFISEKDQTHILFGDELKTGGHLARPGYANPKRKSLFPATWDEDRVLDNVADIVRSPATVWHAQTGAGGLYQPNGAPAVWRAWEVRDGVRIRVVWQPATGRVVTAFPDDAVAKGALVP